MPAVKNFVMQKILTMHQFNDIKPHHKILTIYLLLILTITSNFAESHYNLANVLIIQEKFDKAVFHYESAIKNDSEYSDAYYGLGCILLRQKKFKEVLVNFTQVVKINPDYKQAYNQIGIILLQRGKIKKAEKFFSKAVQIDSGYKDAINNLLFIKKMFKQDEK